MGSISGEQFISKIDKKIEMQNGRKNGWSRIFLTFLRSPLCVKRGGEYNPKPTQERRSE